LEGAEDGESCSAFEDMGGDVAFRRIVSNPSEGMHNIRGLVDFRLQAAGHRSVEPGAHGGGVRHIVHRRLNSLAYCACTPEQTP